MFLGKGCPKILHISGNLDFSSVRILNVVMKRQFFETNCIDRVTVVSEHGTLGHK